MKTCAIVIGHKPESPGAVNMASAVSEFVFNDRLSLDIPKEVRGVEVLRVHRTTYRALPFHINRLNPDFIISLHCNAYNTEASGTEVLYYHTSRKGEELANLLQDKFVRALSLKDRGIKPVTAEGSGGYLLCYTNAPCVIAEPFFIDNDEDYRRATVLRDRLVRAYAETIKEYLTG